MRNRVWLINLYGIPSAPSSFNPDNSLASLAGSLKHAGFSPLILDYQNKSFCSRLTPVNLGNEILKILGRNVDGVVSDVDEKRILEIKNKILDHQFEIVNQLSLELFEKAEEENPLFIGFKIYSGEGSVLSRHLAVKLRAKLSVPFVGGGPVIRVVGKKYMEFNNEFDYLLDGEADKSIVQFAGFLSGEKEVSSVDGLIYRSDEKIICNSIKNIEDLNSLQAPCYDKDVYPILYEEGEKTYVFQLDESRGCPNNCNFCIHPQINGRRSRVVKVDKIIDQIKNIQKTFGAFAFRFTGSNTPKYFLNEFAEKLISEKINIRYSCYASINTTTEDSILKLKKSGLAGVFIGIETTDNDLLTRICNKKGQSLRKVKSILKTLFENEIYATTSWIYPMPDSTTQTRDEMCSFITDIYEGKTADQGSVMLVPAHLLPNTRWFLDCDKYGFDIGDEEQFYKDYSELIFTFWMPRKLMGSCDYQMGGKHFRESCGECDELQKKLTENEVPSGITDDWMLLGRLSDESISKFKRICVTAFISGDYEKIGEIIKKINFNSKLNNWRIISQ